MLGKPKTVGTTAPSPYDTDHPFNPEPPYQLFLKRKLDQAPAFPSIHESHHFLSKSKEFRNISRVQKTPRGQVFVSRPAKVLYCPIGKNACDVLKTEVARTAGVKQFPEIRREIHFTTNYVRTGLQLPDYPAEQSQSMINRIEVLQGRSPA